MKVTRPAGSLKAAQEAAAKVTAMLVASGQLKPSELHKNKAKSAKSSDLFIEEVIINDAPMSARNFLTRSSTQEEISKMSGAAVSTRGRYMCQEERKNPSKNPTDRPLYLHIQAVNQQDVKVAVGRIMHIIMEHSHRKSHSVQRPRGPRPNPAPGLMGPRPGSGPRGPKPLFFRPPRPDLSAPPPQTHPPPPLTNIFREKVFLPANIGLNPTEIRARLLGESGTNLRYIQEETGVAISIRGIGSGYLEHGTGQEAQDTLHFYLEHSNQDQFNHAKDLVVNLAQTIIGEIQQQQQQQQQHQQQPPAPLFTHPPPQQPDVTMGGTVGQPPLGTVQVATHQLSAPHGPPPQLLHSQMVPPQVGAPSQILPPHVGPPQIGPTPMPIQNQIGGHALLAPHLQATGTTQEVIQQQEVLQGAVVSLPQQVVHLTAPPVVSTTAPVANQQLVHTSSGTQLVTLPPGTQIINTSDGPRLVAIATSTQATAPVPVTHQSHSVPLHDPQGVSNSIIHQQPPPQSIPVSVAATHITIGQQPVVSDGGMQSTTMPRSVGPNNSFATVMSNTVSTTSPHTSVALHGTPDAAYPTVTASLPPPSTTLGVPPPITGLTLAPGGTAGTANVCFVLTSGANTVTTTSGMGLLVNQDPAMASSPMNVSQPLLVTGVLPATQQHPQQQQVPQVATTSSFLGSTANQAPSGFPSTPQVLEQPATSAYPPSDQSLQTFNHPTSANTASQHYAPMHPQQSSRVVSVGYNSVTLASGMEVPPPAKIEYTVSGQAPLPSHLPAPHLQAQQGPKGDQINAGASYYNGGNQGDPRPVALEQQWQQFQQQVKVESGQQQYDPYSAADDAELHADSSRQQQPPGSQATQPSSGHMQPAFSNIDQASQQQCTSGGAESENQASSSSVKEEGKPHGTESPQTSYSYYYEHSQTPKTEGSPEKHEYPVQNDQRFLATSGNAHGEVSHSSPSQHSASPHPQAHQGQPLLGQYHYQAGQFQSGQYQDCGTQEGIKSLDIQSHLYQSSQYQHGPQEEHAKLGGLSDASYQPGISAQGATLQGPPPQQLLTQQGPTVENQYQLESQYQQAPPPIQPQQNQQYQTAQYPPGGQYPWAQYPQPASEVNQYPAGSLAPANIPGAATYSSETGASFGTPVAASPSGPFPVLGASDQNPYQVGNNGGGQFPVPPSGPNAYTVTPGQIDAKQQILQDKKAEPGVTRDVTASLLMPPPPPPPSSVTSQNNAGASIRGREESSERSHKRQRSCSSQDEKVSPSKAGSVTAEEAAVQEDLNANRPGRSVGPIDGPTSVMANSGNFAGGMGNFNGGNSGGGGNFIGGPGPGGFSGGPGPGYMNPGGPWGWGPMPRPFSGMPVGPNPFNGPPNGPMNNPQIPFNRRDRDRERDDSGGGGGTRRGGRGGRGSYNSGGRWGRELRL
ncbi:hypothetical protein SK128_020274 [Halocaridina rubra]|uniref:KH homology domain-containing protein 4 n=1 Tax=Halocaridina rubra TaxID=373956 RepID=A0AAN8XRU7_HALRR